ncbi:Hydantoinase B/oxoprolinase-domain-containing protein [Ilyonectria robusta]|uniref:Hydantoinase B/oxoprolinase-domain-containing protein n=1 Tax=Ilyonectria robusta TaxID=1079257 RepID=UPI001E8CB4E6|nr:Hydantoinase B/oxoprolinase-domain-containing protein [Ilyonectria robusta]KAH8737505.1 Hydantoinase B/oxoprolinase-domain-containing protein [Ilyonectria robusta]
MAADDSTPPASAANIRIAIDRGGTFTDVHASVPGRPDIILKLLSEDPSNYKDAPTEGIRRILEQVTGDSHPRGSPLDLSHIEHIRMGTTVGTNALLERKGARSALLVTKGFRDLLKIGNQTRPNIFDLTAKRPSLLHEVTVEVDERVTLEAYTENATPQDIEVSSDGELCLGVTGEVVRVLRKPDMGAVQTELQKIWDMGIRSLSVVFLHSYLYPDHERLVGEAARKIGFSVVESSALQPMIKVVPRGMSATADAYLTPTIKKYIDSVSSNFTGGLGSAGSRCEFMQSDGGLVDFRKFSGLKSILSGPAGGVVGYAQTTWDDEEKKPVIGFDMGGTSTDCSRFSGTYDHVFETTTAGISIQSPQLDINTVAAGGGSMLFWRGGLFVVGPESAGAHPGPACYRKGGPLTVTDANLFLGRIKPEYFPKIFGPNEDEPLGLEITTKKFEELTAKINTDNRADGKAELSAQAVALGFLRVADEVMARPIRALTEARGYDTSDHLLACFGGAGGQHACSLAKALSISRVVVHKFSSILSAYGLSLADVVHEAQRPGAIAYGESTKKETEAILEELAKEATEQLVSQGIPEDQVRYERYLNLRYEGSATSFMILKEGEGGEESDFQALFEKRHMREFGFKSPGKKLLIDDFRVRGVGSAASHQGESPYVQLKKVTRVAPPSRKETAQVCFDASAGRVDTPVYILSELAAGVQITGPALILDKTLTILVVPGGTATITDSCVVIDLETSAASGTTPEKAVESKKEVSPIQLSIFGHRFMSIAEQMGRTLQKTAVSTNIKERLDFSCALFSPDGGLVANAPHVPVHLGSMQFAVKYQHNRWKGQLQDGDVLVSNHPSCGGTHLPDITVITPVFDDRGDIVFYVASRGHHADIGGLLPGSMPPSSKTLAEEGAAIEAEKLVTQGVFNEERITELLLVEPAKHPGCSGTRCLADNLFDLKAQVAANNKGVHLVRALIEESGLETVQTYMYAIQETAERSVRELLQRVRERSSGAALKAVDYMDDGSCISLAVTISEDGSATFDFSGTGPEVYGNTNAPVAITHSAIIYSLRCLIQSDVPLNQGCLSPITINIPPSSLLAPSKTASVVGGNVLTSQRITDVILKAFQACADSQGCMNNLTFGKGGKDASGNHVPGFGYYETIGGGSGAGPTWEGESGVHTHMTNTRITDPEVFEKRYPCLLHRFGIRKGSGGRGAQTGGDGIVRDIEFREDGIKVSLLTERRSRAPRGGNGGEDGSMGKNMLVTRDEEGAAKIISLGGKATVEVGKGDRVVIETPGGGGWGSKTE